jgi:hypothetical protein
MDRPEAKRDTSAPGQAMEFRVWTELIQQSRGLLHVFLPLLDRGLDAVVHRLTDGEYIPVQVKGRGETVEGMVEVVVRGDSLVDDRALIIAGLLMDEGLGPMLLVIDERNFKGLAARDITKEGEVFAAAFSMHPTDKTHWLPYLVRREELGMRLLGTDVTRSDYVFAGAEVDLEPRDRENQWLGFLGESEVVRRLAESPQLDLFRPFPDLEMVEVLARDNVSGRFLGLQVKTAVPARAYGEAHIHVQKATFVPSPFTWVVGLAWLPESNKFADQCLVVPTEQLASVAVDGGDRWVLNFHPASPERTRLDPFRLRLSGLGQRVLEITSSVAT